MGARGPVPNDSGDLARDRARKGAQDTGPELVKGTARPVEIPEPDETWHSIARSLWDALLVSGQSDFYQQSDWAFAYSLCDDLSYFKNATRDGRPYRSPEMLKALQAAMSNLLVTVGDRRRVRVELTAPQERDDATVHVMSHYAQGLGVVETEGDSA